MGKSKFDKNAALKHLKKNDPILRDLIEKVGDYELTPHAHSLFDTLARAIIFQQLSGKAAKTIYDRFKILAPSSEHLKKLSVEKLRTAGVSRTKALALLDLAEKFHGGALPSMAVLQKKTDDEIVEILTQVRGIGPWTAHMFLMFRLHRPDVLALSDYGVRKGFALVYKKRKLPTPEQLEKFAEKWRPYRTVACWYMWRAVDG